MVQRQIGFLSQDFGRRAAQAVELANVGETLWVLLYARRDKPSGLTVGRLWLIYEMAFLRLFSLWEGFLEASFLRYMCGYTSVAGPLRMVSGGYLGSLLQAQIDL